MNVTVTCMCRPQSHRHGIQSPTLTNNKQSRTQTYINNQQTAYSQSKCFFFGPIISCVVALHTVLEIADPVTLCWAAVIRSVMLCPDMLYRIESSHRYRNVSKSSGRPGVCGRCRSPKALCHLTTLGTGERETEKKSWDDGGRYISLSGWPGSRPMETHWPAQL